MQNIVRKNVVGMLLLLFPALGGALPLYATLQVDQLVPWLTLLRLPTKALKAYATEQLDSSPDLAALRQMPLPSLEKWAYIDAPSCELDLCFNLGNLDVRAPTQFGPAWGQWRYYRAGLRTPHPGLQPQLFLLHFVPVGKRTLTPKQLVEALNLDWSAYIAWELKQTRAVDEKQGKALKNFWRAMGTVKLILADHGSYTQLSPPLPEEQAKKALALAVKRPDYFLQQLCLGLGGEKLSPSQVQIDHPGCFLDLAMQPTERARSAPEADKRPLAKISESAFEGPARGSKIDFPNASQELAPGPEEQGRHQPHLREWLGLGAIVGCLFLSGLAYRRLTKRRGRQAKQPTKQREQQPPQPPSKNKEARRPSRLR